MSKRLRALIAALAFITGGLVAFAVGETFCGTVHGGQRRAFMFGYFLSACAWALAAVEFTENRSLRQASHVPYALAVAGTVVLSAAGMFAYVIWAGPGVNATIVIVWILVTMVGAIGGAAVLVDLTARRLRRQSSQPADRPRER